MIKNIPQAAYIHIPFCKRRCYYCDFPISVVGNKANLENKKMSREYVDALCQEIKSINIDKKTLTTVFFGGGTPSLLPVTDLAIILDTLNQEFGIAEDAEISLEVDPGTFNRAQLQAYQKLGVNRLSLGVQAFQDELLISCGRSHTVEDIEDAVGLIQELDGFNFSIDLISGLPKQTLQMWEESLSRGIAMSPHHLSCYDLVVEPVTVFGKRYQPGEKPLPTETNTTKMYKLAQEVLTKAGYQHYEISNYAQSGYQCRHNLCYWQNLPYYGFGMGAASFFSQKRFTRPRTRLEYFAWVEAGSLIDTEILSDTDQILETLMLGLRLKEGVNLQQFDISTQVKIMDILLPYHQFGLVEFVSVDGQVKNNHDQIDLGNLRSFRLQDPNGFLISNQILADLFAGLEN